MATQFLGLQSATVKWTDQGEPEDVLTGDIYFAPGDGLAETKAVFLAGCHLPRRWQDQTRHVIAELGFGTGLNFLTSLALWQQTAKPTQILHYFAVEGRPLTLHDLIKVHTKFPELAKLAALLQNSWPPPVKGFHHITFGQVHLTLLFGPVEEMLAQLDASVDSWFLDGFAPRKNPEMWSEQVFAQVARLSAPQAKLATYSVAGQVCTGLSNAGFEVARKPGHGRKRQRLEAAFSVPIIQSAIRTPKQAMIIGGGIAGACLAHSAQQYGLSCVLIEADGMANGASGNPIGLISPRLDLEDTPLARFFRAAFIYACRFYHQNCGASFAATGIVRRAETPQQQQKFDELLAQQALSPDMLHRHDGTQDLQIKLGGTLRPVPAIAAVTKHTKIIAGTVANLLREDGNWVARNAAGQVIARADIAILANGAKQVLGLELPPMRLLRGQLSIASNILHTLSVPVIGKTYAASLAEDQLVFGATHDLVNAVGDTNVCAEDHHRNRQGLMGVLPDLARQIDVAQLTGRTSYRAASPDLQPMAGPVADAKACAAWSKQYWGKLSSYNDAPMQPGLYMVNGLGSRGLTLAPLLAEAVILMITGGPSPLEHDAATALHPARFAARAARRNA